MTNKQKQNLLAYLGYYVGKIDGIWGTLSKTAMDSFKADFKGLDVPNIPENAPEKALKHAVAYDLFKTEPVKDETSDSWDDIENFAKKEFACKCGRYCDGYPAEIDMNMVKIADAIRNRIDKPISVNSGLRCRTHNANVGGVSNSQHLYGTAADLGCPSGCTPSQMASIAEEIMGETGGIGIYSWGIHIDTRSTKSRWNG